VGANSEFTEGVTQWSTLAMELRVFGVEEIEADRLVRQNHQTSAALARSRFMSRIGSDLYKDLAILFLVGAVGGLLLFSEVDIAAVGAVVLLIVRSLSYAQSTNSSLQSVNELSPNLDSLLARLSSLEGSAEHVGTTALDAIDDIELDDVGYDYEPGRAGIDGVTLTLHSGEAVGVIGPSGGGKSTLVQVLLRLRPPTRGTVSVSGVPYEDIDAASWHRLVTLVPQEPKLFQGTVAENIAFFRHGVTRDQVEEAARLAHVLDDVLALPSGFDTELGPRGSGLSGGQKQRIAIARALVGAPRLLVLDEPSSALDVRSERLLQQTIEDLKGHVTLVIVAHRLTTLTCCDRVIAMANGRIQAIGTLEELAHLSFGVDAPTA
jgi:ABC-type multidrug transport system fused ATPase/permease subunit